jgi:hypothetical protein
LNPRAFSRVVVDKLIGAEYAESLSVGSFPFTVYRIVAPVVVQRIVTLCSEVYVPGAGENVGVETVPVIVYKPLDIELGVQPLMNAFAFSVVVVDILISTE